MICSNRSMKQPSKIPTAIVSLLGCWGLSFTGFAQPLTPDDFDPVRYYLTSSGVYQAYSVVPLTNRMLLVGSEGQDGHGYVDQLNKVYDDGTRVEHFDSRIRGACTSTFYTLNCTIPRIFAIAELPDGKVLAGGHFDLVDGAPQKSLARHTPAGLIDSTFSPPELDGDVHCIAVLDDGKILIGGAFTLADGLSHRRV
ncbi:MAG: delta-60 repeat domain-containing protein, partial [Verrucomicrobiales bacterium]|nr:delta-60 repeat domain-containing protein [Verrucomicrobiales bacterium]